MNNSCFSRTLLRDRKKLRGTVSEKNRRQKKSQPHYSAILMTITINLDTLTPEQVKFLSQLGMFQGEATWKATCEPEEFDEAVELLKRAGIDDVFVEWGERKNR